MNTDAQADAPPVGAAAAMIDALMAEAEAVDDGEFTLDASQAVTKLDRFRYDEDDRDRYLIVLADGLVGLGAERIEVEEKGEDVVLSVRISLGDPASVLRGVYEHLLGHADTDDAYARSRIAAGIDMVLTCEGTRRVVIEAPLAEPEVGTEVVVYRRRAVPEVSRTRRRVEAMRVLIDREKGGWWPGRRAPSELRYASSHCPVPIVYDDHVVSQCGHYEGFIGRREVEGLVVEGGLSKHDSTYTSELNVLSNGIEVASVELGEPGGFESWVEVPRPRWDLTQTKLVQDERHSALVEAAHALRERSRAEFREAAERWGIDQPVPDGWNHRAVNGYLGRLLRPKLPDETNVVPTPAETPTRIHIRDRRPIRSLTRVFVIVGVMIALGVFGTTAAVSSPVVVVSLTVALIGAFVAWWAVTQVTGATTLVFRDDGGVDVTSVRMRSRTRRIDPARVKRLRSVSSPEWRYFGIRVELEDDSAFIVARHIQTSAATDWVLCELRDRMGLGPEQIEIPERPY